MSEEQIAAGAILAGAMVLDAQALSRGRGITSPISVRSLTFPPSPTGHSCASPPMRDIRCTSTAGESTRDQRDPSRNSRATTRSTSPMSSDASRKNTVCAIVHQFGVPTFQSVYRDLSGFLVDGVIEAADTVIPLHTPDGWLCRDAKAWRKHAARLSIQLGFQEHFDANADPPDWMSPDFLATPEAGWNKPFVIGPRGRASVDQPRAARRASAGRPRRAVPVGRRPVLRRECPCLQGRRGRVSPARSWRRAKKEKSSIENVAAILVDDSAAATVPARTDGTFSIARAGPGRHANGPPHARHSRCLWRRDHRHPLHRGHRKDRPGPQSSASPRSASARRPPPTVIAAAPARSDGSRSTTRACATPR